MSYMKLTASVLAMAALSATAASARDQVLVVGSSTVFPYSQAAAENFANATGMRRPSLNRPAPAAASRCSAAASAKTMPT